MAEVQLRRYAIVAGQMDAFVEQWRRLVPIREKFGFTVLFGFADRSRDEFVWAISHDGDFDEADQAYKVSADHAAVRDDLRPFMAGNQSGKVDVIVDPRAPASADPSHD